MSSAATAGAVYEKTNMKTIPRKRWSIELTLAGTILVHIFICLFDIYTGLPLGAKFQSERTQKYPFVRCFNLNPIQIRGGSFIDYKIMVRKVSYGHNCLTIMREYIEYTFSYKGLKCPI